MTKILWDGVADMEPAEGSVVTSMGSFDGFFLRGVPVADIGRVRLLKDTWCTVVSDALLRQVIDGHGPRELARWVLLRVFRETGPSSHRLDFNETEHRWENVAQSWRPQYKTFRTADRLVAAAGGLEEVMARWGFPSLDNPAKQRAEAERYFSSTYFGVRLRSAMDGAAAVDLLGSFNGTWELRLVWSLTESTMRRLLSDPHCIIWRRTDGLVVVVRWSRWPEAATGLEESDGWCTSKHGDSVYVDGKGFFDGEECEGMMREGLRHLAMEECSEREAERRAEAAGWAVGAGVADDQLLGNWNSRCHVDAGVLADLLLTRRGYSLPMTALRAFFAPRVGSAPDPSATPARHAAFDVGWTLVGETDEQARLVHGVGVFGASVSETPPRK